MTEDRIAELYSKIIVDYGDDQDVELDLIKQQRKEEIKKSKQRQDNEA